MGVSFHTLCLESIRLSVCYLSIFFFRVTVDSINKDAWPSLQLSGKTPNGLTDLCKSPTLDGGLDCEHLTPDGPDSELGLGSLTSFTSLICEPTRYSHQQSQ